jgi:HlyD family secretion protein
MVSRKKSRRWPWALVSLLVLGGAAFFSLKALNKGTTKIDPEKLVKVERIDLTRSVVATGKIEAASKVEIKSKASGIIQKLPFDVGDVIHQGQVICELDKNDLLPRVREATASLNTAEAAVTSAKADYERSTVEAAGPDLPFLKRDMERARKLLAGGLIAQNARDEAEKQYEMASNRQRSATANLSVGQAAIAKAEAQLEQTRAVLARA